MAGFGTGGHPKRHYYTVQDIAKLSGRAVGTVRNDSCKGVVDLDSLESVFKYVLTRSSGPIVGWILRAAAIVTEDRLISTIKASRS